MTLQNEGASGASEQTDFASITVPADAPANMSTTQAARMLATLRNNPRNKSGEKETAAEAAPIEAAPAVQESEAAPAAEDAAPARSRPTGETQSQPNRTQSASAHRAAEVLEKDEKNGSNPRP